MGFFMQTDLSKSLFPCKKAPKFISFSDEGPGTLLVMLYKENTKTWDSCN